MKRTATTSAFQTALIAAIRKQVSANKRDGIVSMGIDNLRQITPPSSTLDGAPRGTNAAYFYAREFGEACAVLGIK